MERRRGYRPRTQVAVGARVVVKESEGRPDHEVAKAAALAEVGRCRGFAAPEPLAFDAVDRTVTYERIEVGVPLGSLVPLGPAPPSADSLAAFDRAGAALGAIHAHLHRRIDPVIGVHRALPAPVAVHLGSGQRDALVADAAEGAVVGHGDYSVWNVFDRGPADAASTVVLDCCPNGYSSFETVAHESRYLDLALFDSCLYGRAGFRDHLRLRARPLRALRGAFLGGYERGGGRAVDRALLRATTQAVLAAYLASRRGWPPPFSTAAGRALTIRQWRR